MSEFLNFIEGEPRPKTKTWEVWSRPEEEGGKPDGGGPLGEIRFYGAWRCYAFYPGDNTIFEKGCLRDIARFCEERTNEWRRSKLNTRAVKP